MRHIREVFVALAVFVFSVMCVVFFVISLTKLGWQRVGPENSLGEMVGPSVKCLCVTAGVAYGVSLLWRASPVVLGVVAAAPYFLFSCCVLYESEDGVAFWAGAGIVTFAVYVGAVCLRRRQGNVV